MARKERKGNRKKNYGTKLTFLTNDQVKKFLDKYKKIIYFQCKKRSYIPGMETEDLEQECIIKLVGGYHLFDKNRGVKEKTWVVNVINKTLDGIWNYHLKSKRACHVCSEDGMKPVYNFSLDEGSLGQDEKLPLQEVYVSSPDGRPVFGTISESPEESLFFIHALEFLKTNLSKPFYEYIKSKVFPDSSYEEVVGLEEKFRQELIQEGFTHLKEENEFVVYCNFSGINIDELKILNKTAFLMIDHFDFRKEDIFTRKKMTDIVV